MCGAWRRGDEGEQASQSAFSWSASCGRDSVAGHCLQPVFSPLHTKRNRRILTDVQGNAQREVTLNVPRYPSHTHRVCFPHSPLRPKPRLFHLLLFFGSPSRPAYPHQDDKHHSLPFSLLPVLEILLNTAASMLPAPLSRHSVPDNPCRQAQ